MSEKNVTINELMVNMKIIRERLSDLKSLRQQTSVRERYYGSVEKATEPQYDVKLVDKKITELQNFLAVADAAIKNSNAKTKVKIDFDVNELLKPLE